MCMLGDVHPAMLTWGRPPKCAGLLRPVSRRGRAGRLIMAMGCAMPPDAKLENVKAMVDSVQGE